MHTSLSQYVCAAEADFAIPNIQDRTEGANGTVSPKLSLTYCAGLVRLRCRRMENFILTTRLFWEREFGMCDTYVSAPMQQHIRR
jgi:hypothetical protein